MNNSLQWRHNGHTGSQITSLTIVYSHVFQEQIKENIKAPRHCLCAGNSPVTDEFPAQMVSNAEMSPFDDVIIYFLLKNDDIRG